MLQHKRVFVVFNPVAGTGDPDELSGVIERGLEKAGWDYTFHRTEADEEIETVTQQAPPDDYDLVIAAGGDGTVSGVAGGLVKSGTPMAIVPSGTGNALARYLDIPVDPEKATDILTTSSALKTLDTLRVEGKHYILSLSVGPSAATMEDTGRGEKRQLGLLAYLINGVKKLLGIQPAHFRIIVDGTSFTMRAADVLVLNHSLLGSVLLSDETSIALDEGEVGVLIFRAKSLLDYLGAIWDALWGRRSRDSANLRVLRAGKHVVIEPDTLLPVQADGEALDLRVAKVDIVPQAVNVVIPEDGDQFNFQALVQWLPEELAAFFDGDGPLPLSTSEG